MDVCCYAGRLASIFCAVQCTRKLGLSVTKYFLHLWRPVSDGQCYIYNDPTYMLIYINHDWMKRASNCDSSIGNRHPLIVRWEFSLFTISNIQGLGVDPPYLGGKTDYLFIHNLYTEGSGAYSPFPSRSSELSWIFNQLVFILFIQNLYNEGLGAYGPFPLDRLSFHYFLDQLVFI